MRLINQERQRSEKMDTVVFRSAAARIIDLFLLPFVAPAGYLLRFMRGRKQLIYSRTLLKFIGVIPVTRHYYEPFVDRDMMAVPSHEIREIIGLDLNIEKQLLLLNSFKYAEELSQIPLHSTTAGEFGFENGMFEGGDAEYLYNMIRHFRPATVIEVGGGHSTLLTRLALAENRRQCPDYHCSHLVFEPFENPWLEESEAIIHRKTVESCDPAFFETLESGDILFVDSSHVVRSQGDVLYLFCRVFGRLKPGVLIHLHDVFTPRDYPERWIVDEQRLWTEQYLLEAFLAYNKEFEVIGSVNHLWKTYPDYFLKACPMLPKLPRHDPGSFWFRRK